MPTDAGDAMRPDLVLTNATVLDASGLRTGVDVVMRGTQITRVAPAGGTEHAGAVVVDCGSRVLVPGYANIHNHFYSALLRGAPPARTPARHQRERLERVIWPFERRLTSEDVRIAVRLGLVEAIAAGTTTIIDHHASSRCIPGVLDVIADEVAASGLRAVLCYEVTDRDGPTVAAAGLTESERFLSTRQQRADHVRGMVGLHAMSTVGRETLERAAGLARRFQTGLHLHVGESEHDNVESLARDGARPIARLEAAGALSPQTLIAHAVHTTVAEVALLASRGALVAHNPRSNAANGVGVADLDRLRTAGIVVGVGGDGFTQDIRTELDLIPLLQRQYRRDPTVLPPSGVIALGIGGNAAIVARVAGWRTGRLAPDYVADIVALDYDPIVPLRPHNALWHYARGLPGATVRDIWVGGRQLLRDAAFQTLDVERVRWEVSARLETLWRA